MPTRCHGESSSVRVSWMPAGTTWSPGHSTRPLRRLAHGRPLTGRGECPERARQAGESKGITCAVTIGTCYIYGWQVRVSLPEWAVAHFLCFRGRFYAICSTAGTRPRGRGTRRAELRARGVRRPVTPG